MPLQRRTPHALVVSAIALVFSISAQAAASRTFVATTGNDSNTTSNCGATTPCRTFTAALSVTNPGGEVVVLNSGGYGPATISQAVIITAIGIDASISVTTLGGNGLTINTSGNVTITGLNLHGEAAGNAGIEVLKVGFLRLYNMLIENFAGSGVDLELGGNVAIYDSEFNDSIYGVLVDNVLTKAYIQGSSFNNNGDGVGVLAGAEATVVDSSAEYNTTGAFAANGGTLTLINDRAAFNAIGLYSLNAGTLYFANCLIANNTTSYSITTGGTMAGTSPGTSLIAPGQGTSGTLGTAIILQ